ncbi:LysR family transcriptional regulator [Devosia pacifica]|uniref:LysR family transcriptional regulator n=1 Tax=Devosia pacifica TaxID=1335967 RepID=A0A918S5I7_9HYPH|nr:LysR family transcriptional regulator [Devosia pacifica]GHA21735.1 LysR family transcriptional regulator [Devosia pacifica]
MKHLKTLRCIEDVASSGSIRKSAEQLSLTASALTRKIQDFETELGTPIFERMPQGMRLNAAGELVLRHIRAQLSDFERLRSQIADLSGVRRGHVTVAVSQAFAHGLIPKEIASYRARHPLVSFSVLVRDHVHAVRAVAAFEADVALVITPPPAPEFEPLLVIHQPLCALMSKDHPLAKAETVRFRDCLQYPIAMPGPSLAIRHHLQSALVRASLPVNTVVESDSFEVLRSYTGGEQVISFQIRAGIPQDNSNLVAREIDHRDMPPTQLVLGQLRGRSLSVAASKFVDQISGSLHSQYGVRSA